MFKDTELAQIKLGLAAAMSVIPKADWPVPLLDAMVIVDKKLGNAEGAYFGVLTGRSSQLSFASSSPKTKWTKFEGLAKKFATREEAVDAMRILMEAWATKHLWRPQAMNAEELLAFQVMEALK